MPAWWSGYRPRTTPTAHSAASVSSAAGKRSPLPPAGGTYAAPAQRVEDFLAGRASTTLGSVVPSYRPGVTPADLAECLPATTAVAALREALLAFDARLPGFAMADAVMTGVETRTSAPIRIPRGRDGHSLNTSGLFPAGEGAGYAGGILSAAVDGIRIAEAVALDLLGRGAEADMATGSGSYGQNSSFFRRPGVAGRRFIP